jgi:hypothetical protein
VSSAVRSEPTNQRWELRQRSLPEIFDIAFVLYRTHFKTYLLALALPSFLWLLGGILFLANSDIAITLLYYDLRIRREGLDIALLTGTTDDQEPRTENREPSSEERASS